MEGTQVEVHVAAYTFERLDAALGQVAALGCCLDRATGKRVQGVHAASCLQRLGGDRQVVGAGRGGQGDRRHELACWLCTPVACAGFAICLVPCRRAWPRLLVSTEQVSEVTGELPERSAKVCDRVGGHAGSVDAWQRFSTCVSSRADLGDRHRGLKHSQTMTISANECHVGARRRGSLLGASSAAPWVWLLLLNAGSHPDFSFG